MHKMEEWTLCEWLHRMGRGGYCFDLRWGLGAGVNLYASAAVRLLQRIGPQLLTEHVELIDPEHVRVQSLTVSAHAPEGWARRRDTPWHDGSREVRI